MLGSQSRVIMDNGRRRCAQRKCVCWTETLLLGVGATQIGVLDKANSGLESSDGNVARTRRVYVSKVLRVVLENQCAHVAWPRRWRGKGTIVVETTTDDNCQRTPGEALWLQMRLDRSSSCCLAGSTGHLSSFGTSAALLVSRRPPALPCTSLFFLRPRKRVCMTDCQHHTQDSP